MAKKKQHTVEEQRAAMDKIGGFVYQFYYFLNLLLTNKESTVSFEKLDDAAIENGKLIKMIQAKHTVRVNAAGDINPLTNRSSDLWKAVDVWRKFIIGTEKENRTEVDIKKYIEEHEFIFVSNREFSSNIFAKLCMGSIIDKENVDKILDEITNDGRPSDENPSYRTVQMMIDDLKAFELRDEFLKKISFVTISQSDIQKKCVEAIKQDAWFAENEAENVFNDFLIEAVKDFAERADKGEPLSYTYEERRERFLMVFQYHRTEKLDFRIRKQKYKKDFIDLVCINQLIKVKDFSPSDTDSVAKCASYYYSFKNRYDELIEKSKVLEHEDEEFRTDAIEFWDTIFKHAYKKLGLNATEEEIIAKAQDVLFEVRKHELKLRKKWLGLAISNGAYYYLSDECLIGWHRDWQKFFKKKLDQNGQDNQ